MLRDFQKISLSHKRNQHTHNIQENITLRHFNVTIVAVEKQKKKKNYIFWVCVRSHRYSARKAHAPFYIIICGLSGCTIFCLISQTARFWERTVLNIKCVVWFPPQLLPEIFLILRRIERDMITHVHRSSCKVRVILTGFWCNLNFLERFRKNTEIFLILRINERDMITHAHKSSCKVCVILTGFDVTWIFSKDLGKILKYFSF